MKMTLLAALTTLIGLAGHASAADFQYAPTKTLAVPGDGGWDYLSVDEAARKLYVAHGNKVDVIDLDVKTVVGEITNTPGVHGLAPCPDLGLGVVSVGQENQADIVDLQTLQSLARVPTAAGPDAVLYDAGRQEAYLFCGRAHAATVVNVPSRQVTATIPLPGRPEFATVDRAAGRVYDNIEDQDEVAVIDTQTHQVVTNWPCAPGREPSGLAMDTRHHRLFIGCRNQKLVMMDSTTGRVLDTLPIGAGVDACVYDPHIHVVFASCGDGTTTIARVRGDHFKWLQTLQTMPGARTMAVDPVEHNIFLAAAKFTPGPAGRRQGKIIPGSFEILAYGPR